MRKALIFGRGGHARVIASFIQDRYGEVLFVTLDGSDGSLLESEFWEHVDDHRASTDVFVGIGDNALRRKLFDRLEAARFELPVCIADGVFVARDARVGSGSVLCPGAIIMTGAEIGRNVVVNTNASVDHDCVVGDHSQLAASVTLAGGTKIGTNCFLGIRSATIPRVTIGANSQIMAGSLVVKDVPGDVVAGGFPAIVLKQL